MQGLAWWNVMSCHVMSTQIVSCKVNTCHVMSCHAMSSCVNSDHVMSTQATSTAFHVMSRHIMSPPLVMSCLSTRPCNHMHEAAMLDLHRRGGCFEGPVGFGRGEARVDQAHRRQEAHHGCWPDRAKCIG